MTLSFIEIINVKKAKERAITKLLNELQSETGTEVEEIIIYKVHGFKNITVKIKTSFESN